MKFTVPAPALKAALAHCAKVASKRLGIPILSHVRVEAGETITVRASDLDTYVSVEIGGETAIQGTICAPADELLKLATAAGKAMINIEASDGALRLTWGRASAALKTLPADEFPDALADGEMRAVDGDLLRAALGFCAPSAARGDTRFYLCGVFFSPDGRLIATDGHRLSLANPVGTDWGGSAIIPNEAVPMILSLSGPVRFHLSERRWGAAAGGVEIWGKVIDGAYPDFDRFIPLDLPTVALVDRDAMIEAIKVASIGSREADNKAVIAVRASDESITVRGIGGEAMAEGARAEFDADIRLEHACAMNAGYLAAALGAIESDRVALLANDEMLRIEPVEQRADLRLLVIVLGRRASAHELAA